MKLSIVTINLNNAIGLEKTLNSIENQIDKNFELIVVDGNSLDKSLNVIKEKQAIINHFVSESDNGIFDAQNKGYKLASSEYILFLNSGDKLADDKVTSEFNNIDSKNDMIVGDIIFDLGNIKWRRYYKNNLDDKFFFLESLPHSSTFIKRELLDHCGGFNTNYKIVADYDFFIKAIFEKKSSYSYLNLPISIFNKEGVSSDESANSPHIRERNEVFISHFGRERFEDLKRKRTYYNLFYKKIPYIYNFIKSYFSLNIK